MTQQDPYDVLGVTPDAEEAVIDAAYQSLIKNHHPDHGGESERFKEIVNAYEAIQEGKGGDSKEGKDSDDVPPRESDSPGSLFSIFDTPIDTEAVIGRLSDGLILEGDHLTIGLTGITRMDVSDYVFSAGDTEAEPQLIITLHVVNTSDYVQKFNLYDVRVVGDDERRYDAQIIGLGNSDYDFTGESKALPGQLMAESQKMEPHTKGDFVAVIKNIPDTIEIDRVVYPFKLFDGHQIDGVVKGKTRYVFDIQPEHWREFRRVANGKLEAPPEELEEEVSEIPAAQSKLKTETEGDAKSTSQSQVNKKENDVLTERDAKRLADIVDLQPTTNSELQERWEMDSGSEVHEYLENSVSDFYHRNDSGKIVADQSTERFLTELE